MRRWWREQGCIFYPLLTLAIVAALLLLGIYVANAVA
jgi:hypothetical protein